MPPGSSQKPASRTFQCKVVLLGEAAVGKSSLVSRFVSDDFNPNKESTIGAAFSTQRIQIDDNTVKLEIWDTAGQERFHSLAPMYYRNASAALVVFDVTKSASLERARAWVEELRRQANQKIIISLVGNKIDLVEDVITTANELTTTTTTTTNTDDSSDNMTQRQVSDDEARRFATENNLMYYETSAKTGHNVTRVFQEIAKAIVSEPAFGAGPKSKSNELGAGINRLNLNQSKEEDNNNNCSC